MVNRVTLVGRLGSDPEVRTLENGVSVARIGVATTDGYYDKQNNYIEQTEWHDVVLWRGLAERAQKSLQKGTLIYLEGKLTHRKWQDKEGNNRKSTEVVGSFLRIMSGRREVPGGGGGSSYGQTAPGSKVEEPAAGKSSFKVDAPDDIPF